VTSATYVLIHGAGDSGWYWHLVDRKLREHGHDVVVMDLPVDDDEAGLSEYADVVVEAIGRPAESRRGGTVVWWLRRADRVRPGPRQPAGPGRGNDPFAGRVRGRDVSATPVTSRSHKKTPAIARSSTMTFPNGSPPRRSREDASSHTRRARRHGR
jgi:hypothetical protein